MCSKDIFSSSIGNGISAAVLLAMSGTLFAQGAGGPGGPGGMAMKTVVSVGSVMEVENIESNNYTGVVLSPQVVRIVSRVSGELLEIGFKDGDLIKKGQMLYRLDDIKYQASVKNAEAQVAQWKAKVAYSQKSYDRNNTLYERQAVSKDTWENAQSTLDSDQASLSAAEADLISAREDLKNCTVTAPIDGVVATTNYTAGNYLTPSSGTLVTIFQIDPIRIRFSISTRDFLSQFGDLDNLKRNGLIDVTLSNNVAFPEAGKVELVNLEANRNTDTVQIYALFDNPEGRLIPNSAVTVTLKEKSGQKLPSVPLSAIMHDSQGAYVWLLDAGNKVKKRHVTLGNDDGSSQMILSGLKLGDAVVTDGTHKVAEGTEVEAGQKEK